MLLTRFYICKALVVKCRGFVFYTNTSLGLKKAPLFSTTGLLGDAEVLLRNQISLNLSRNCKVKLHFSEN